MSTDQHALPLDADDAAQVLVSARRRALGVAGLPFPVPGTADAAYAIQQAAMKLWPAPLVGWKVGAVGEPWRSRYAIDRLAGPVFADALQQVGEDRVTAGTYGAGFGAVEAEFVFRIGEGAHVQKSEWTFHDAGDAVASLHGGVEIASSPMSAINDLGPGMIIADFGNNAGLLVGPEIPGWRERPFASLRCVTRVDGSKVGEGNAGRVPGSPLAALAFALNHCARIGRPLRAGQHVCTGATTGIHAVQPMQQAEVEFEGFGTVRCLIEALPPR